MLKPLTHWRIGWHGETVLRRAGSIAILGLAVIGLMGPGCGPIEYVHQVTNQASAELAAARAAHAQERAPYHYTRAVEFLKQARVEAAEADYQAANRFGAKAEAAAREARKLALSRGPSEQP